MQAIAQDDTNSLLEEILGLLRKQIPEGKSKGIVVAVGPSIVQLDKSNTQPFGMPWRSVMMFNDGPCQVYHVINRDYFDQAPWNPNEGPLRYDMTKDQIERILFTTGAGGANSTIRIFATK